MNYYKVDAKCGHVGRYYYIIKSFFVEACDKKEAASLTRQIPRVKHHQKDAIRKVEQISYISYLVGKERNKLDPYFFVTNSSEQRRKCPLIASMIIPEEKEKIYIKTHMRRILRDLENNKEWKERRECFYE